MFVHILREKSQFSSYRGPNFDNDMYLGWVENQAYFSYLSSDSILGLPNTIVTALVRVEELDSVKNASLPSATEKNNSSCSNLVLG